MLGDECAKGQSFECLGNYPVRAGSEKSYEVTWRSINNAPPDQPARGSAGGSPVFEGATVKACPTLLDCDTVGIPLGVATVGA